MRVLNINENKIVAEIVFNWDQFESESDQYESDNDKNLVVGLLTLDPGLLTLSHRKTYMHVFGVQFSFSDFISTCSCLPRSNPVHRNYMYFFQTFQNRVSVQRVQVFKLLLINIVITVIIFWKKIVHKSTLCSSWLKTFLFH